MKSIRLIILLFSSFIAVFAQAQGFLKTYTPLSSNALDLLQCSNGDYFMAGHNQSDSTLFLQRVDGSGALIWFNHLDLNHSKAIAASQASDGGFGVLTEFYAEGNSYKNALLKLNPDGTQAWVAVISNNFLPNGLRDVSSTPDGGFLLAGDTRDASLNFQNWLVKIAEDGSIDWQKTYGTFHNSSKMIALPDGNFAISGGRNGGELSLALLNPAGDLLWQREYQRPDYQRASDLLATPDGGFAIMGTHQNTLQSRLETCILKTDGAGNQLWFKSFYPYAWNGTDNILYFLSRFALDQNGNFYIPVSEEQYQLAVVKLDTLGNHLWKRETVIANSCNAIVPTSDGYFALCGGNSAFLAKMDLEGEFFSNRVQGRVYQDVDADCLFGAGDLPKTNCIIEANNANGTNYYRTVNPDGTFEIRLPEGDFELLAKSIYGPINTYIACDTPVVSIVGNNQTITGQDIGIEPLAECPMLDIEISQGILRRCVSSKHTVNYCNYGNATAENAFIEISVDTLLEFFSSSIPLTAQNGQVYTFNIPDLAPGDCGSFYVFFRVKCTAEVGDVICVEAHAFPDSTCLPPGANWDGSSLEVTGQCENDVLSFKIKNTGTAPMSEVADYVIIEDHIMYMQGGIQLNSGADTVITIPNPGGACYLGKILDWNNSNSIVTHPTAVVENCIAGGNLDLALEFETGENNYAVSTACASVVGSFDPNDKQGFPLGWTDQHLLERNQDIEYLIRFQNTGNDTAFLVIIRDTLPATLDPSSLRPIAASHDYSWDVSSSGIATFTFPNILLPDSTTNEPESHGYVRFKIRQKPDLPDGTTIENRAAIYFDFNDPIMTDPYFHTIGRPVILVTKTPGALLLDFQVYPNPFSAEAQFVLKDYTPKGPVGFTLINSQGAVVLSESFLGNRFHFRNPGLPDGLYFFQMEAQGRLLTSGKVLISK